MGVSDYIIIKYPLPIKDLPQTGWQSKGIYCGMHSFILTEKGRLLEEVSGIEIVDNDVCETGITKLIDHNFEGVFNCYNMVNNIWYEFEIVMIDGVIVRIRTIHGDIQGGMA